MWGGPGSQGSAPSGSQPMKDPRNLRDAAFRSKMRQEIVGWLQTTGLDIPNSVLQNITGKDFGAIFKHLVSLLDPNWPFRDDQRWEEQFMPPLKALRYPFVVAIDPRWLATPAAQHSWPTLLGVLHWLVQMGKVSTVASRHNECLSKFSVVEITLHGERASHAARPFACPRRVRR